MDYSRATAHTHAWASRNQISQRPLCPPTRCGLPVLVGHSQTSRQVVLPGHPLDSRICLVTLNDSPETDPHTYGH